MTRLLLTTVALVTATACGGTKPPQQRPQHYQRLQEYVTTSPVIQTAANLIQLTMVVAAPAEPAWGGFNPRELRAGEFGMFIVDAQRMQKACDTSPSSYECATGRIARNNCAAVDDRTVICDSAFLATLWILAVYQSESTTVWDDHFASTFAKAGKSSAELLRIADALLETRHKSPALQYLWSYLELMVLHELGHVVLHHPTTTAVSEASEAAADTYAVRLMAKHPERLADAVSLFQVSERYMRSLAALAIGMPEGRRATAEPNPSPQQLAAFNAAYAQLSCPERHAPLVSRLLRMSGDRSFAPVYRLLDRGWFETALPEAAGEVEAACAARRTAVASGVRKVVPHDVTLAKFTMSDPEVRVLDAGREPRARVQYAWKPDDNQLVLRNSSLHVSEERAGRKLPEKKDEFVTRLQVSSSLTATSRGARSQCADSEYTFILPVIESDVPKLTTDLIVTWCLSPHGRVRAIALSTRAHDQPAITEDEAASLLNIPELAPSVVVLPDEPIGVGARWTVSADFADGRRVTRHRLLSRNNQALEVESDVTFDVPGKSNLPEQTTTTWKVHYHVDLTRPIPGYEFRSSTVVVGTRGGQHFKRELVLETKQAVSQTVPGLGEVLAQ